MLSGLFVAFRAAGDGSVYIPYYTSRQRKIEYQPGLAAARSHLRAGGASEVAFRLLTPPEAPLPPDARVKVRLLRIIGATYALGDDLPATFEPDAEGGVWVVRTHLDKPGGWRADLLVSSADGRRGEQQVIFEVR